MVLLPDLSSVDGFTDVVANIGLTTWLFSLTPQSVLLAAAADSSGFLPFRIGRISHSAGSSLGPAPSAAEQQLMVQAVRLDDLLNAGALSE